MFASQISKGVTDCCVKIVADYNRNKGRSTPHVYFSQDVTHLSGHTKIATDPALKIVTVF